MVIKYAEKARWIGSRSSSTSGSRRTANAASATDGPFGFANTKAKALRDRDEVCQNGLMSLRAIRTLCAHPPGSTNATLRAQREPHRLRLVHTPPSSSEKFVRMSRASPSTQSSGWLAICEVRSVVPEQEGSRRPMPNVV